MKTNQTDVAIVVIMINLKIFRFLILLLITKLYIKCTLPSSSSSEYEKRVKRYCDTIGLTVDQQHFCYMHSDIVKVFINGSQYGHKQCQKTFKFSNETGTRWNCTNLSNKTFLTIPKPKEGSKEAGILTSFIAAGILYHLLQACVKGNSLLCTRQLIFSCPDRNALAEHHNCNKINWQIPEKIIGMFFKKIPNSYRYDIFEHNLQVGFDVLKSVANKNCLENICQNKQRTVSFDSINHKILNIYKNSNRIKKRIFEINEVSNLPKNKLYEKILYYKNEFDYCNKALSWRWMGIGRRECEYDTQDSYSLINCFNLCCWNGYIKSQTLTQNCKNESTPPHTLICTYSKTIKYYCKYRSETTLS